MRPFLICIHDATPAYADETRIILRDLAPLVGRSLSFGVVPNWHGAWHLADYPDYCRLIQDSSEELLLHGYFHQRQRGWGPITWLTEGSDEMNGLNTEETQRTLAYGQHIFKEVFGSPAHGFLAPGWQQGQGVWGTTQPEIKYLLGFCAIESWTGNRVPLATWSWDGGRWGWLGQLGYMIGWLLHSLGNGVPTLAIHPRDLERGYWHQILHLIRHFLDIGYQPSTVAGLLEAKR